MKREFALVTASVLPAVALAAAFLSTQIGVAQAPSPAGTPASPVQRIHPQSRPAPAHQESPAPETPAAVVPAAPEAPRWPVNDQPGQAAVTWDSQGLRIDATNSSLQQIMKDVSTATGTKVEGMSTDERVFGAYGPGQARDVLSQLLQGAGYNVMMIGDQGHGAPRQILLSVRNTGDTQAAKNGGSANNSDDDAPDTDADEQPVPQPPMPGRPGFGPGGPGRTPQQMQQMREQQMQQMQQRLSNPPQN